MANMIPFVDLQSQYKRLKAEIDQEIQTVLDTCAFIMGPQIQTLEKTLSEFTGATHSFSCASGTDALLIAMMALDIQPGDEIITTPFTFFATGETIGLLKAVPVFVDIESDTYNIDVSQIESKITSKTKAIIPVSLYGQVANMDEINAMAQKHNIPVIEDAAQSFGATYKGKKSCNLSTIGCTSFFPAKPLGCYGDGGALFTSDDQLAEKIMAIRNHGQVARYTHKYIGINGRMDTIQAAVLNVKLKYYNEDIKARQENAALYTKLLSQASTKLTLPVVRSDRDSVWAQYTVRVQNREHIQNELQKAGIPTAVHYPIPLYKQEALKDFSEGHFPISEKSSKEVMSLPICGETTKENIEKIAKTLLNLL